MIKEKPSIPESGLVPLPKSNTIRWKWMAGSTAAAAAAASTAANAGTVQITQSNNLISSNFNLLNGDFTGDGTSDMPGLFGTAGLVVGSFTPTSSGTFSIKVDRYRAAAYNTLSPYQFLGGASQRTTYFRPFAATGAATSTYNNFYAGAGSGTLGNYMSGTAPGMVSALVPVAFVDANINGGAPTNGFLDVKAFNTAFNDHTVQIVRLVFDDANPVAPTGVTAGGTDPDFMPPAAEIDIRGGTPFTSITSGDTTPSVSDDTDFGNVTVGSAKLGAFQIRNTGSVALNVASATSTSPDFTVSPVAGMVASGANLPFSVTFSPTSPGVKLGTITVNNSDSDEGTYTFTVTGTGVAPPAAAPAAPAADPNAAAKAKVKKKIKKLKKKIRDARARKQKPKLKRLLRQLRKLNALFRSL